MARLAPTATAVTVDVSIADTKTLPFCELTGGGAVTNVVAGVSLIAARTVIAISLSACAPAPDTAVADALPDAPTASAPANAVTSIVGAAVAVTAMLPPAMAIESSIVAWIPTPGVFSLTRLIDTEAPTATPTPLPPLPPNPAPTAIDPVSDLMVDSSVERTVTGWLPAEVMTLSFLMEAVTSFQTSLNANEPAPASAAAPPVPPPRALDNAPPNACDVISPLEWALTVTPPLVVVTTRSSM